MDKPVLRCKRCGHKWIPKAKKDGQVSEPKNCPVCNSPYWNIPVKNLAQSEAAKEFQREQKRLREKQS